MSHSYERDELSPLAPKDIRFLPTSIGDPPINGLAPMSQQELMQRALEQDWEPAQLATALNIHDWRHGLAYASGNPDA